MSDTEDGEFDDEMREYMNAAMEDQNFPQNLFLNILGGEGVIFQYDHPYDSDDDDLYYIDDDDLFNDDSDDDNARKIFVTLQDSHIIKRLSFHKNVFGHFRFPRYMPSKNECYEDLYRLLEEVELMVRVWRRRSEHPYTAHLRSEVRGDSGSTSGETLVEGEDYKQSDYEYDGSEDDEMYYCNSVSTPNEALTKKKYCQSVKIYQRIFDNTKQFDAFQRLVFRMKKYVFRVVFNIFMETLPPETASRLPQELWEKIWKYTQNDYFRYIGSLPLLEDSTYYKAGQRTSKSSIGLWSAEQERIGELFGAVGNLHISLFEILFKNPFNQWYHFMVEEWESGGSEGNMLKVIRMLWWKHYIIACQKFSRLRQFDVYHSPPEEGIKGSSELSLFQKVEKGIYTIKDVSTDLQGEHRRDLMVCQTGNIIVSLEHCTLFAVVDHAMNSSKEDFYLTLRICNAATGKVVRKINTGLKYSLFQIERGKFAIRRLGKMDWRRNLYLTEERISVLYCDLSDRSSSIRVWSHKFEGDMTKFDEVDVEKPIVDEVVAVVPEDRKSAQDLKSSVHHSKDKIVVCFQTPWHKETVLNVFDGESGELILNVNWPGESLSLVSFKENRALLINDTAGTVNFFSTDCGESIESLPFATLNEGTQSYGPWTGIFDSDPLVNEFALIRSDNSKFQLYSYDPSNEMSKPTLSFSGIANDTYKLSSECLSNAKLKNGIVFFNRRTHITQDIALEETDSYHEVSALNLRTQSCCPIITMCSDVQIIGATKYNEFSLTHFDPKFKFSDFLSATVVETFDPAKRPLFFINATSFGIITELEKVVKIFDFDHDERSVLAEEERSNEIREKKKEVEKQRWLKMKQESEEKERRRKEAMEEKERRRKEAMEEYVDADVKIRGRVEEWRGTYGFLRSRGAAGRLGWIFFHRSNVHGHERRRYFGFGTELEYNIIKGRDPGTFQAVNVVVLPRH